nr:MULTISPECIES: hypothetical protein [Methylorubrum]
MRTLCAARHLSDGTGAEVCRLRSHPIASVSLHSHVQYRMRAIGR